MSFNKRKLHSVDLGNDDSSPSKKSKTTKISSKSVKRPRSLFEGQRSSGESSSDFEDDAERDPDWLAETSSHCLPPEDPDEDDGDHAMDSEKIGKRKLKRKKEKKKGPKVAGGKKKKDGVSERTETCDLCMRVQHTTNNLVRHKKGHDKDERSQSPTGVYKCTNCLKRYDEPGKFGAHQRHYCPLNATGEGTKCGDDDNVSKRVFTCDLCMRVVSIRTLAKHKKGHDRDESYQSPTGVYKCTYCLKRYDSSIKFATHQGFYCLANKTGEDTKCGDDEVNRKDDGVSTKKATCDLCLRVVAAATLVKHKKGHNRDEGFQSQTGVFKCMNCLKCYDDPKKLGIHQRHYCPFDATGDGTKCGDDEDTGNRNEEQSQNEVLICENSKGKFKSASAFPAHSLTHFEQSKSRNGKLMEPIRCPKCKIVYSRFHYFKIHYETFHINKGICIHKCNICRQRFDQKSKLERHKLNVHGKAACRYCHMVFETKVMRRKHEHDTHSENSICEFCGRVIKTLAALIMHRRRCRRNPNRQEKTKKFSTSHCSEPSSNSNHQSSNVEFEFSAEEHQSESKIMHEIPKSGCYECKKCSNSFEKRSNLLIHRQSCQLADDVVEKESHEVEKASLENKLCICDICKEMFPSQLRLLAHESVHRMLVCEGCNESMPDEECLLLHVLLECPERYKHFSNGTETGKEAARYAVKVRQSDKPTVSKVQIVKTVEVPSSSKISRKPILRHVCKICNRKVQSLTPHIASHKKDQQYQNKTGQYKCPYCQKGYNSKYYCHVHERYLCRKSLVSTETKARHDIIDTISPGEAKSQNHVSTETNIEDESVTSKVDDKAVEPEGDSTNIACGTDALSLTTCNTCTKQFDNAELLILHEMVHVAHCVVENLEEENNGDKDTENGATNTKNSQTDGLTDEQKDNMNVNDETQLNHGDVSDTTADEKNGIQSGQDTDAVTQEPDKICGRCNVEFCSAEALTEHKKRVSMLEAKYPSRCPSCEYAEGIPCNISRRVLVSSACEYLQHKKKFRFICLFCTHHFKTMRRLRSHIEKWHDYEDRKECPGCHSVFGPQMYKQHVEYNRKEVERLHRKCLSCGSISRREQLLDHHAHKFNKSSCDVCNSHFKSCNHMTTHKRRCHNVTTSSKQEQKQSNKVHFQCKHCDQYFQKASQLSAHVKNVLEKEPSETRLLCSWEYRYSTCLHCGMTFTKHSDWKLHKCLWRYMYECVLCSAHFLSNRSLKSHQHTHTYKQDADGDMCMYTMSQYLKCKYCGHGFDTEFDKRKHEFLTSGNPLTFRPCPSAKTHEFPRACEECGEILTSVCQLDIHMTQHKQAAIVSCRFCRTEFRRIKKGLLSLTSHATKVQGINTNCSVCGLKYINTCHKRMHAKKHSNKCCRYCKSEVVNIEKHEREASVKSECSVCSEEFPSCELFMNEHRKHVEEQIVGKVCAFCRVTVSQSDYNLHQRFKKNDLLCSCGVKIQAKCQKKLHDGDRYVCKKCGAHFGTYQDLVRHLMESNNALLWSTGPHKSTSQDSGKSSEKVLIKVPRWDTVEKNGKTIYTCLYCRDEVETEEEKDKHQSTFKYECPQCRKHYRSSLAAFHHFRNVEHVVAKQSKPEKRKQKYRKTKNDMLAVYVEQSVCDQFKKVEKVRKELLEKEPATAFHIGFEEYSVVTQIIEVATLDDCVDTTSCSKMCEMSEGSAQNIQSTAVMPSRTLTGKTSYVDKIAQQNMKYRCPHCKKDMTMWAFTQNHLHSNNKGLLYTCLICDASFDMECGFEYHLERMCKHCGAHFDNMEAKCAHEEHCKTLEGVTMETSRDNVNDEDEEKEEEQSCDDAGGINITTDNYPSLHDTTADVQTEKDNGNALPHSLQETQIALQKRSKKLHVPVKQVHKQEDDVKKQKCDLCSKIEKCRSNKRVFNRKLSCYQNDDSPKWLKCVCLHCNIELPTKCHISYHHLEYRYQCGKKNCRKHFKTLQKKSRHTCSRCELCMEMNFDSRSDLEMHKSKWHTIIYKKMPVPPLARSCPRESVEQVESVNVAFEHDDSIVTTLSANEGAWTSKVYSDEEDPSPGMGEDLGNRNRDDGMIKDEASHHEQVNNQGAADLIQRVATLPPQSNLTFAFGVLEKQQIQTQDGVTRHGTEVNHNEQVDNQGASYLIQRFASIASQANLTSAFTPATQQIQTMCAIGECPQAGEALPATTQVASKRPVLQEHNYAVRVAQEQEMNPVTSRQSPVQRSQLVFNVLCLPDDQNAEIPDSRYTSEYQPSMYSEQDGDNRDGTEFNQGVYGAGDILPRQNNSYEDSEDLPITSKGAQTLHVTEKVITTKNSSVILLTNKRTTAKPPATEMMSIAPKRTEVPSAVEVIPQKDTSAFITAPSIAPVADRLGCFDISRVDTSQYFAPVAGGFRFLYAEKNQPVKKVLISSDKGNGYFVEGFTVDHKQYLAFNHPAWPGGVFRKIDKQEDDDLKFTVTLMASIVRNDEMKGGEVVTGEDALVVEVGSRKVAVKELKPKPGVFVYKVKLVINKLPITKKVVSTLPVNTKVISSLHVPVTTTMISNSSVATKKMISAQPPAKAMMPLAANAAEVPSTDSVIPQKDTSVFVFAASPAPQNDGGPVDINTYYSPVAGGLGGLADIINVTRSGSVKRTLLVTPDKGNGYFVEVFDVGREQYLAFNHPACSKGVYRNITKQGDNLRFTVTLMANDKNRKTLKGGEVVTGKDALVVKLRCKAITVKALNPKPDVFVYIVELVVNQLPITKKVASTSPVNTKVASVSQAPVTTTVTLTASAATNKMSSAQPPAKAMMPLAANAAEVPSTDSVIIPRKVTSAFVTATSLAPQNVMFAKNKRTTAKPPASEIMSLPPNPMEVPSAGKVIQQKDTPAFITTLSLAPQDDANPVDSNKYYCPVAGGLGGLFRIISDSATKNVLVKKTNVAPDKGNGYFVECFTVNHQRYLAFNHPATHKGSITKVTNSDLKFAVAFVPKNQKSKTRSVEGGSGQDGYVVRFNCKECDVKAFIPKPGTYVYTVELKLPS